MSSVVAGTDAMALVTLAAVFALPVAGPEARAEDPPASLTTMRATTRTSTTTTLPPAIKPFLRWSARPGDGLLSSDLVPGTLLTVLLRLAHVLTAFRGRALPGACR